MIVRNSEEMKECPAMLVFTVRGSASGGAGKKLPKRIKEKQHAYRQDEILYHRSRDYSFNGGFRFGR